MVKRSRDQSTLAPSRRICVVDAAAVFFFPLPDAALEFFAAELLAGQAFGCELAFHDHLRGDAGMIRAGKPQRDFAPHAMPADGDIHHGVLEHVADMQRAGDVGRRNDDGEDAALLRGMRIQRW